MISIKPGTPKKLTFSMAFRGMDLSNAKARVLIPVSESVVIIGEGRITDKNIMVKIPAIENVERRKTEAILEVITADGKYFNPFRGDVEFLEEAVIENVTLKEDEDKEEKPKEMLEVKVDKTEDVPSEKRPDVIPKKSHTSVIKEEKSSGFRRFLKDKS